MSYRVKEIFYTLQGEGGQVGRPSVFCRFSGCNLWSGQERHRSIAICQFCDTEFVGTDGPGGGVFRDPEALAQAVSNAWAGERSRGVRPYVVCTGGEPLLQLDDAAIAALHHQGFEVAVETNGTLPVPEGVDWICVSPKAKAPLRQLHGDDLKVVFPQDDLDLDHLRELNFKNFLLQPMDGPDRDAHTRSAITYCLEHPQWRLSLQTHKYLGIR